MLPICSRYALSNALMMAFIGALAHGGWPICAVAAFSVLIGAIDEAIGDDQVRKGASGQLLANANLYATLPLLMIITYLLLCVHRPGGIAGLPVYPPVGILPGQVFPASIGAVLVAGYFYALAGVTVAHELSHRVTSPFALLTARVLFAFTINPTFESYHINGHHRNVCTFHDPSTARRGEYILEFIVRSVVHQTIDGWCLEVERLSRKRLKVWSWHNRVLDGICCSLAIFMAAAMIAGIAGIIAFSVAAIFGRIVHEMINYVQHYGIVRAEGAPIEARHSWDCDRLLSNALLYNLPRHADHHRFATKPYWELDAPASSPKLPYGYQTMSLIALYRPWWHRVIDPLLADWDRRLADDSEKLLVRECGWTIDAPLSILR